MQDLLATNWKCLYNKKKTRVLATKKELYGVDGREFRANGEDETAYLLSGVKAIAGLAGAHDPWRSVTPRDLGRLYNAANVFTKIVK